MEKTFDLVLWGATGFTGRLTAEYLAQHAPANVHWALAGRNQEKLFALRQALADLNPAAANLPILIGDSRDQASIDQIVSQTRVVCSTVGPYALYGTPLVAACAAQGVDYCDLTGETIWIRANIEAFHAQAEETGARIVHCCGFDSIPSDLGTLMVQDYALQRYGRPCETVNLYVVDFKGGFSGGTVASMLNMLEESAANPEMQQLLADPYSLVPGFSHDGSEKDLSAAQYDAHMGWTGPFLMEPINSRIVRRSNALQNFRYGRDFRYGEAMCFPNRLAASAFAAGYQLFLKASGSKQMRGLLEKTVLPEPGEGPSQQTRDAGCFVIHLLGNLPADLSGSLETWVRGVVAGSSDPGYGETAKMLGEAALCLASDDLPQRGGILTTAVALGQPLITRLRTAGMVFEVETLSRELV